LEQNKKGFFETMGKNATLIPDKYIYSLTNSIEEGYRDFKTLLSTSKEDLPEVLFCEDDYMALAVMRALSEEGIPVPGAVSVIGVDNISLASTALPPLTTIKVDTETMSKVAVDRIIEIIDNGGQPTMKFTIDTVLIERESCRM
jgi:LacI family transcriptional regulator